MSDKFKICECGSCRQAFDRAAEIVKKMDIDGECPAFMVAVACGMRSMVGSLIAAGEEETVKGIAEAQALLHGVSTQMLQWASADTSYVLERVNEVAQSHNEMLEKAAKLPRGL